jgi:uncharacterized protein YdcH (DUF465 family)
MKHHVLDRFPEHAKAIEDLGLVNAAFEALTHRYGDVIERLRNLNSSSEKSMGDETELLKKRKVALEEELLLMINSNRP